MTSSSAPDLSHDELSLHVTKIRESGILARSAHLHSLFEFLYTCHLTGRVPKEFEIAIEGMGRSDGFDVTQDAMVRVYMHKLRKKLDEFYEKDGKELAARITIPKGEYRFVVEPVENINNYLSATIPQRTVFSNSRFSNSRFVTLPYILVSILTISIVLNFLQFFKWPHSNTISAPLWQPLFDNDKPLVVVVGDYYIFAETDGTDEVKRLVRDFDLNSAMDLSNYLQLYPNRAERQFDVNLSYIPTGTAYALNSLGTALNSGDKKTRVVLASEVTPEILRSSNIVYIGHLSGLGLLSDIVFEVSKFHIGSGFDELIDSESGEHYVTSNFSQMQRAGNISHLAYLSSFVGPNANHIIIVAGFRDEGLRELVENLNSEAGIKSLNLQNNGNSFEAIYKAAGYGHTISPAKLIKLHKITKTLSATE